MVKIKLREATKKFNSGIVGTADQIWYRSSNFSFTIKNNIIFNFKSYAPRGIFVGKTELEKRKFLEHWEELEIIRRFVINEDIQTEQSHKIIKEQNL